jgi:hypothetical protein
VGAIRGPLRYTCSQKSPGSGTASRGHREYRGGGKRLGKQLEAVVVPSLGLGKEPNDPYLLEVIGSVTPSKSPNFKLCVSLGVTAVVMRPLLAILDTGAGVNLVREDVLPPGWELLLVPDAALPHLTNASGRWMPIRCPSAELLSCMYRSDSSAAAFGFMWHLEWRSHESWGAHLSAVTSSASILGSGVLR